MPNPEFIEGKIWSGLYGDIKINKIKRNSLSGKFRRARKA